MKRVLTAGERVKLARSLERPRAKEYIDGIFDDFVELAGDGASGEDKSMICGIAKYRELPVTVIGQQKGTDFEENMVYRFGMPNPEGYRKAIRLMKQAEKFKRPVITFVDTPGAYPGKEAEERGQGQAIAKCIQVMSMLRVPTITFFIGEGGSGGALAIATSDRRIMLENSIFSILSPEGFASILWHDAERWEEASDAMRLTASDILQLGACDEVVPEPDIMDEKGRRVLFKKVDRAIDRNLRELLRLSEKELLKRRYRNLRNMGKTNGGN